MSISTMRFFQVKEYHTSVYSANLSQSTMVLILWLQNIISLTDTGIFAKISMVQL